MSAIIPYLQPGAITNAQSDITDLQALSGMPDNSLTHGTFSGVTIPDGQTTRQALQALETEVELRDSDIIQSKVGTGPGYYSKGTDSSYISGTQPLSPGLGDFSIAVDINIISFDADNYFATHNTGNNRFSLTISSSSGYQLIWIDNGGVQATTTLGGKPVTGRQTQIWNFDRDGNIDIYVNGKLAHSASASFLSSLNIGSGNSNGYRVQNSSVFGPEAVFYGVKYFNRKLAPAEVALVSNGQNLGFADVGPDGNYLYFSNRAGGWDTGVDGWAGSLATVTRQAGTIGGENDVLRIEPSTDNATHYASKTIAGVIGKRYRLTGKFFIPSANTSLDGVNFGNWSSGLPLYVAPSLDTWVEFSLEFVKDNSNTSIRVIPYANGTGVFAGTAGDYIYIKDIEVTPVGQVLDLNPNGAAPAIWADASGNGYNGTVTGAKLINQQPLHADTFVSFTNLPTSSAGLATGQVYNDSGTLKIV